MNLMSGFLWFLSVQSQQISLLQSKKNSSSDLLWIVRDGILKTNTSTLTFLNLVNWEGFMALKIAFIMECRCTQFTQACQIANKTNQLRLNDYCKSNTVPAS